VFVDHSLDGWRKRHPFDQAFGTDTSGYHAPRELRAKVAGARYATGYAAVQPGVLRRALQFIPEIEACTFWDIGCGKGRALVVASEFPFRRIFGVELDPDLARTAQRNAEIIAHRFPQRRAIRVLTGSALELPVPPGPVVAFLYHPFHRNPMTKLVRNFEHALNEDSRPIWVVYCNPVLSSLWDRSGHFARLTTETIPFELEEMDYAPGLGETVAIWRADRTASAMDLRHSYAPDQSRGLSS
jgi:SAM-dependent methyltransferase